MQCGISTSCFYPQETAEALSALRGAGVETVEIFLNTFSELELSYTERLRSVLQDAGMRAAALHPFTSGMETFFFASEYGGRLEDGLRIYRRYFEVCRVLGIPRVVFHGDYSQTPFPFLRFVVFKTSDFSFHTHLNSVLPPGKGRRWHRIPGLFRAGNAGML